MINNIIGPPILLPKDRSLGPPGATKQWEDGPPDNKFEKVLDSKITPQIKPKDLIERGIDKKQIADAGEKKAMLKFMDSVESELGIPPAKIVEAMAKLKPADLVKSPEETAAKVVENLSLSPEQAELATGMYLQMLMQMQPQAQQAKPLVEGGDLPFLATAGIPLAMKYQDLANMQNLNRSAQTDSLMPNAKASANQMIDQENLLSKGVDFKALGMEEVKASQTKLNPFKPRAFRTASDKLVPTDRSAFDVLNKQQPKVIDPKLQGIDGLILSPNMESKGVEGFAKGISPQAETLIPESQIQDLNNLKLDPYLLDKLTEKGIVSDKVLLKNLDPQQLTQLIELQKQKSGGNESVQFSQLAQQTAVNPDLMSYAQMDQSQFAQVINQQSTPYGMPTNIKLQNMISQNNSAMASPVEMQNVAVKPFTFKKGEDQSDLWGNGFKDEMKMMSKEAAKDGDSGKFFVDQNVTAPDVLKDATRADSVAQVSQDFMMSDAVKSQTNNGPVNVQQLMNQAQYMIRKGGGEMNIELHPQELGRVDLKVAVENGKVQVKMVTQTDEAKKLIESNLGDLKNQLTVHRMNVENVQIDVANTANKQDSSLGNMSQQQDMGREAARQFLGNFREHNFSQRQDFFDATGFKSYQPKKEAPKLEPVVPKSRPRGKGQGLNLVA